MILSKLQKEKLVSKWLKGKKDLNIDLDSITCSHAGETIIDNKCVNFFNITYQKIENIKVDKESTLKIIRKITDFGIEF